MSGAYLQILSEQLFYFTKVLNITMVRNFEVMLKQPLNHSV
jgi:hypothetical protein